MPIGVFDIRDRQPVFSPDEIDWGIKQCAAQNIDYVPNPDGSNSVVPVAAFVERLKARWQRFAMTAKLMDAIRAGYCTIEPKGAAEPSRATH